MLNKIQLQTMALQWARTYRPSLLDDLSKAQAQAWAQERAEALLEAFDETRNQILTSGQTAPQMQTQIRALWEELIADHFPATSAELDESSLSKAASKRLKDKQTQFQTAKQAEGLDPEEIEEIWTAIKPGLIQSIQDELEYEEANR